MRNPKVLVAGNNLSVTKMFKDAGFAIVFDKKNDTSEEPDLVCFTGGADVHPHLYGEQPLRRTFTNPPRDTSDLFTYRKYQHLPKVGICRGGQFLNIMAGGAMWQHVDNHTTEHDAIDLLLTKNTVRVTSTHHQMMIPNEEDGDILCIAQGIAQNFDTAKEGRKTPDFDTEVVWYRGYKSLCFQPHPEYDVRKGNKYECRQYFFDLLNELFDISFDPKTENR